MRTRAKRWLIILAILSSFLVLVLFVSGLVLSQHYDDYIKNQLRKKLAPATIDFDSLKIDLFTKSLAVKNIKGNVSLDSLSDLKHEFSVNTLQLRGIHVLEFFSRGKLEMDKIVLKQLTVVVDKGLLNDSLSSNTPNQNNHLSKKEIHSLEIGNVEVEGLSISVRNDTITEFQANINLNASDIFLPFDNGKPQLKNFHFKLEESSANDLHFSNQASFYETSVQTIHLDRDNNISIDSIHLKPKFGKYEFGRKFGKQTDRFETWIPLIKINRINTSKIIDSTFKIGGIHLYSPQLKVFRDKRLPFIKHHIVPLPVNQLKELPFTMSIDTLQLHDAFISYEEFPIEGDSSGTVRFSDLQATAYHITNADTSSVRHIDLDVETKFMGSGLLKASFDFPLNERTSASAEGTLYDFHLPTLNPIIGPLAKMRIESGHMAMMDFHFTYDKRESNGEVNLNYSDLKIVSLTEKESKTAVNKFKTFLLNTFIISKKKNQTTSSREGSGTIQFTRDTKRSIFNYWWKSLFTGIKSTYGLEVKSDPK